MKLIKKTIGLMLILVLVTHVGVPITYALTEPEQACATKRPKYDELIRAWDRLDTKDQNDYKTAFDSAQTAHHDYVGCMFDFAERILLKSDGAEASGTMDANTLNTGGIPLFSMLIDWMTPNQACLTSDELKRIIQKTDPSQMLGPILQAHADYKGYLNKIGDEFDSSGVQTGENGQELNKLDTYKIKSANRNTIKRERAMEIQSSLMVIDLMFTSLKELRLSLVMHVQFQCTLKFLEKYRKALEGLRNIIEPLPAQLEDASITK